jgi:GTP pyrophosphokinase
VLDRPRPRANEDEAIAALLHDAIEDGRPIAAAKATVSSFGDEVGRIVDGCTDADEDPKPPWFERKQAYMARLATDDRAILLVSASDKLHNARSIVRDLRAHGDKLWSRFNAPRECTLWYYRSLVIAYQQNVSHTPALVEELDRIVSEMEDLAGLHQETDSYRKAIASGEACRTWSTSIAAGQGQE